MRDIWRVSTLSTWAFALTIGASALQAQDQHLSLDGRDVAVWRPRGDSALRHPVLVFSHGFGGCATQSKFLMEALADRGYLILAPNHKDARCGKRGSRTPPAERFVAPDRWNDKTYHDRAEDVRAVLAGVAANADLSHSADLSHLGLMGHSLGGYTMLGLAGAWASWKMPGVKAVLAMSPYVEPYLVHGTIGGIAPPVMYQGGTLDFGITPSVRRPRGAYETSPSPKYFVEFVGAGHFAWTDLRPDSHDAIVNSAVAFLDRYVRGSGDGSNLTSLSEGIATLRYSSELGSAELSGKKGAGRRRHPLRPFR